MLHLLVFLIFCDFSKNLQLDRGQKKRKIEKGKLLPVDDPDWLRFNKNNSELVFGEKLGGNLNNFAVKFQ